MFTEWIGMARITRAQVLKVKEDEFVLASRTMGAGHMFIIFKEILPNIFGQLIIMFMMSVPNAISVSYTHLPLSFTTILPSTIRMVRRIRSKSKLP